MSLADGGPFNFVRPEHVVDLGTGARANHQGDGNASDDPRTLARRAASVATAVSPTSEPRRHAPTTAISWPISLRSRRPTRRRRRPRPKRRRSTHATAQATAIAISTGARRAPRPPSAPGPQPAARRARRGRAARRSTPRHRKHVTRVTRACREARRGRCAPDAPQISGSTLVNLEPRRAAARPVRDRTAARPSR